MAPSFSNKNTYPKVLLLGATGATGRLVLAQLLAKGCLVKAVVRTPQKLSDSIRHHDKLELVKGTVLGNKTETIKHLLDDCHMVISCLGHKLSFKGVFGQPRRLVKDTLIKICEVAETKNEPTKIILMSSAGCRNPDESEIVSFAQKVVISLLRLLLPPHADNEEALEYLRNNIGQKHSRLEWCAVRPDALIDEEGVSNYKVFPSPIRSAIFNSGKTSRINVANFMSCLMLDDQLWEKWRGKTPVVYNS